MPENLVHDECRVFASGDEMAIENRFVFNADIMAGLPDAWEKFGRVFGHFSFDQELHVGFDIVHHGCASNDLPGLFQHILANLIRFPSEVEYEFGEIRDGIRGIRSAEFADIDP